jgi:hypothetical protein
MGARAAAGDLDIFGKKKHRGVAFGIAPLDRRA